MQNVPIRTDARARDPRLLRGRARQRPAERRLLADRAARARPHRRRAGAQGDLRARRGRPHGDRLEGLQHAARAARPRPALEGEDDQLRDRLRPVSDYGLADRLGIPREEAKEIIDTYLERFPAVRAFIEATIEQRDRGGPRARRCGAGGARSPSSRRATGRCARSASGWRSTPSSRARRPTS